MWGKHSHRKQEDMETQIVAVQHESMSEALILQVSDKATVKWIKTNVALYMMRHYDVMITPNDFVVKVLDEEPEQGYTMFRFAS